jgi:surface protein
LSNLDVSGFDTANVTDMRRMFCGCSNLESLDVSHFYTSKLRRMNYMFENCASLTSIDLGSFDTSDVFDMTGLFSGCKSLTILDLSNFNTDKCHERHWMLRDCCNLKSIYVNPKSWNSNFYGQEMFKGCEKLVGENGTKYNPKMVGVEYARIDGGKDNPGYLTAKE